MTTTLDFAGVVARSDLRAMIVSEAGQPGPSGRWPCPIHKGKRYNLEISKDGRRFRCYSGSCGATGTVLDWVALRDNITIAEAARKLGGEDRDVSRKSTRRAEAGPGRGAGVRAGDGRRAGPVLEPAWQAAVSELVEQAARDLWGKGGREALGWLRARGLADDTIGRFRLGYLPTEGWTPASPEGQGHDRRYPARSGNPDPLGPSGRLVRHARRSAGTPMGRGQRPQVAREHRRPAARRGRGYRALWGSRRGFAYPFGDLALGVPALIVEGEADALIGWQQLGHVVNVATVGAPSRRREPRRWPRSMDAPRGSWHSTATTRVIRPPAAGGSRSPRRPAGSCSRRA